MESAPYTTQLQAGLGLVQETKELLEIWEPGMRAAALYETALSSGRFPNVTARRLRNIVAECFAPRYLKAGGQTVRLLKTLRHQLSSDAFLQLLFLYTCRANPILADFVRDVYWARYEGGYDTIESNDARRFVERGIDDGKTSKRWSESTIRRVAAYLTGCCADFGLLQAGLKSTRQILPFRIAQPVAAYLAYDLHFLGMGDNTVLAHEDWGLFGLSREDVIQELKRASLQGSLVIQSASDIVRISWTFPDMEALCDGLT